MVRSKLNLPNLLTIIRIILAPLVFIAIFSGGRWMGIGSVLFGIGAITDWMDGYLARKHKLVTGFGQFADPVADKLLSGFALAGVAAAGYIIVIPVIAIILRDVIMTSFRLWGISKGVKILPSKLAKTKTLLEMGSLILIMVYASIGGNPVGYRFGSVAISLVGILAWITMADYFWKNRGLLFQ
ncbi:CDP-diacylglycerol--glycerol-3-phosphate 3-phosphatidyltransferase [bacterium]|nr:CDP-diacylglycerol--glycerol-3-phosphate 3-phosphatidyltransferase [bacterium]